MGERILVKQVECRKRLERDDAYNIWSEPTSNMEIVWKLCMFDCKKYWDSMSLWEVGE